MRVNERGVRVEGEFDDARITLRRHRPRKRAIQYSRDVSD
jgi:hypothetical protein